MGFTVKKGSEKGSLGSEKKHKKKKNTTTKFSRDCPGIFWGDFVYVFFLPHKE